MNLDSLHDSDAISSHLTFFYDRCFNSLGEKGILFVVMKERKSLFEQSHSLFYCPVNNLGTYLSNPNLPTKVADMEKVRVLLERNDECQIPVVIIYQEGEPDYVNVSYIIA